MFSCRNDHKNIGHCVLLKLDDHLAGVAALEQLEECGRHVVDAFARRGLERDRAIDNQRGDLLLELLGKVGVLAHHEPAQCEALADGKAQIPRTRRRLSVVVLGDGPAHGDAAERVRVLDRGLEVVPADVVEVNVDARRRRLGELAAHVAVLVVERLVEADAFEVFDLLRGACGPDHLRRAEVLRNLSCGRAHSTCRARDKHDVALFHLADGGQPDVGGQSRQAEDAQVRLCGGDGGVDLLRLVLIQDGVCAPPAKVPDRVARFELAGAGLRDCADRGAVERLIDLEWLDIGLHVVHPPAHVGVDAGEGVLDENLAVGKLRQLHLLEPEVLACRCALRAGGQDPLLRCSHAVLLHRCSLHVRSLPEHRVERREGGCYSCCIRLRAAKYPLQMQPHERGNPPNQFR